MVEYRGIIFPSGEQHLPKWMQAKPHMRAGKGTYQYEKYETALKYTTGRRVAVDIGAHVGLWSRVMALDFDRVHSFEPVEKHIDCYRRNLKDHLEAGRAVLHAVALGSEPGWVCMVNGTRGSSGDTWVKEQKLTDPPEYSVPLAQLDSYELRDVDFLKVDNEGYEFFALRGAEDTLKRCRPVVIVEQKPGRAQKFGLRERQAVEYLQTLGATLCREISGDFILAWL